MDLPIRADRALLCPDDRPTECSEMFRLYHGLKFEAFPAHPVLIVMTRREIEQAIQAKKTELEVAMEMDRPRKLVMKLYKELKELQFKLLELDHPVASSADDTM